MTIKTLSLIAATLLLTTNTFADETIEDITIVSANKTTQSIKNTTSNPNINNYVIDLGSISSEGDFEYSITNVLQNTECYFRAYAIENNIITYGEVLNFRID